MGDGCTAVVVVPAWLWWTASLLYFVSSIVFLAFVLVRGLRQWVHDALLRAFPLMRSTELTVELLGGVVRQREEPTDGELPPLVGLGADVAPVPPK